MILIIDLIIIDSRVIDNWIIIHMSNYKLVNNYGIIYLLNIIVDSRVISKT